VEDALKLPPPALLGWLDWLVVALYLVAAVVAGLLASRKAQGSSENFFLSGRNLPWWLLGTSMVATAFSSDTPLVVTGWTRAGGLAGNWRWWGYLVGTMLVVVVFARLWRRSRVLTDVEFMELRYSGLPAAGLRAFKALYQVLFVHCMVMGWVFLSMQKLLGTLLGLGTAPMATVLGVEITPAWISMTACVLLTFVYCEASGLWGVVVTDFLQFGVAMAGAIVLAVVVVQHMGGLDGLVQQVAAVDAGKLSAMPQSGPQTWDFVVFFGLLWCANKNADGGGVVIQRILAGRDERHSLLGTLWYAVANFGLRGWPWILVALASLAVLPPERVTAPVAGTVLQAGDGRVVLQPRDGGTPVDVAIPDSGLPDWRAAPRVAPGAEVKEGALLAAPDDEQAYAVMMRRFLPVGLLGLMVASFLAAFMSTVDSHINIAGAYLVNDLYRRFLRPDAPEAHYLRAARWVTPLIVLVALGFAARFDSVRGMFDIFTKLFGGVGVAYLLRWVWWRVNVWSEVTVLAVSATLTLLIELRPAWFAPLLPEALLVDGVPGITGGLLLIFAASLLAMLPVTLLTPPVDHEHLARFVERVRPVGLWGPVRKPADWTPEGPAWWVRTMLAWAGAVASIVGLIFLQGALFLHRGAGFWPWLSCAAGGLLLLLVALPSPRPGHRAAQP
jgi:Na+/proline symporter